MPKIPIESARVNVVGGFTQPQTGGGVLGGIADAASDLGKFMAAEEKRDAAAYVSKATSDFQLQEIQEFEKLQTEHDDLDTFSSTYMQGYNERLQAYTAAAPNQQASELLSARGDQLRTQFGAKAIGFQQKEKTTQRLAAYEETSTNYAATVSTNYGALDSVLQMFANDVAVAKNLQTVSETKAFSTEGRSKIVRAAIEGLSNRDPWAAEREIRSGKFDDVLGGGKGKTLAQLEKAQETMTARNNMKLEIAEMQTGHTRAQRELTNPTVIKQEADDQAQRGVVLVDTAKSATGLSSSQAATDTYLTDQFYDLVYKPKLNENGSGNPLDPEDVDLVGISKLTQDVRDAYAADLISKKRAGEMLSGLEPLIPQSIEHLEDGNVGSEYKSLIQGLDQHLNIVYDTSTASGAMKKRAAMNAIIPEFLQEAEASGIDLGAATQDKEQSAKVIGGLKSAMDSYIRGEVPQTLLLDKQPNSVITGDTKHSFSAQEGQETATPDGTVSSVITNPIPKGLTPVKDANGKTIYQDKNSNLFDVINGKKVKL